MRPFVQAHELELPLAVSAQPLPLFSLCGPNAPKAKRGMGLHHMANLLCVKCLPVLPARIRCAYSISGAVGLGPWTYGLKGDSTQNYVQICFLVKESTALIKFSKGPRSFLKKEQLRTLFYTNATVQLTSPRETFSVTKLLGEHHLSPSRVPGSTSTVKETPNGPVAR